MRIFLLVAMLLASASEIRADIYRYDSADGVIYFTNSRMNAKGRVVVREPKPRQSTAADAAQKSGKNSAADKAAYHSIVEEKAKQHDMDPQLVKAVIKAESNWNAGAVSNKGAQGLMQLMPSTASLLGVVNPFDPVQNIDGGIRYLKHLLGKFGGNLTLALAAYNAGPKLVEKKGGVPSIPETVAYVRKVLAYYGGSNSGSVSVNPQEIQKEIKREYSRIKRVIMEDGTLLFTNSPLAHSSSGK